MEAHLSRTRPLRAPTKTYSPAGEPSALRPVTSTRQASVGARCTASTTRSCVACAFAKSTTEAAFAVAAFAVTEAVVGSWKAARVRPDTERKAPPFAWCTTKSPPTTSRPWKVRVKRTWLAPDRSTTVSFTVRPWPRPTPACSWALVRAAAMLSALEYVGRGCCLRRACRGDQGCGDAAEGQGRSQERLHAGLPEVVGVGTGDRAVRLGGARIPSVGRGSPQGKSRAQMCTARTCRSRSARR